MVLILVVTMVLQVLPISVLADDEADYPVKLSTNIVSGGSNDVKTSISTGQEFELVISYEFQPNTYPYNDLFIYVTIPHFEAAYPYDSSNHSNSNNGASTENSYIELLSPWFIANNVDIDTSSPTSMGIIGNTFFFKLQSTEPEQTKEVRIRGRYKNMITPDRLTATFSTSMEGLYYSETAGSYEQFVTPSVTSAIDSIAGDEWIAQKSIVGYPEMEDGSGTYSKFYYVTYRISAILANSALYEREGRLYLDDFKLTDTMPTNIQNGGKGQFVSVQGDGFTITDSDYYFTGLNVADKTFDTITFTKWNTKGSTVEGDLTPADAPIATHYLLTVRYPRDPYRSPTNQLPVIYNLTNDVQLTYTLRTKSAATTPKVYADVEVGWWEYKTSMVKLEVQKYLKVLGYNNDQEFVWNSIYNSAGFTLYTDTNGTLARDIDYDDITYPVWVDSTTGIASIPNLRYGTYYIKETLVPDGFTSPIYSDYIEIYIDMDGNVTLPGAAVEGVAVASDSKTLTVTNTADSPPAITSANSYTCMVGTGGTFQVVATGSPTTFTYSLTNQPTGVNISGTGLITVADTVAANTYNFTVGVDNGINPPALQAFELTVVVPVQPVVNSVTVSPKTAAVEKGETQQFTAVVSATGGAAQTVAWSVDSTLSSIDANGLLSVGANETKDTLTVTATSTADNTKKDTATVTVKDAPVTPTQETEYTIRVTSNNTKYGTVKGGGTYKVGESCILTATPKAGYRFVKWTEGGKQVSKSYQYKFTVDKARTLKVEFAKIGTPSVKAMEGYNGIKLSWKKVSGVESYEIYRKAPGEKSYKKIAATSKTTYTNMDLKFNKSYSYKVRAVCKAGKVTTYGAYSKVLTVKTIPATPTDITAKKAATRALKISWVKVLGAQGYQVYRYSKSPKYFDQIRLTKNTSFLNTQLTKGKTYYFKVRAYRMDGGKRVYGKFSKVISVKVK